MCVIINTLSKEKYSSAHILAAAIACLESVNKLVLGGGSCALLMEVGACNSSLALDKSPSKTHFETFSRLSMHATLNSYCISLLPLNFNELVALDSSFNFFELGSVVFVFVVEISFEASELVIQLIIQHLNKLLK